MRQRALLLSSKDPFGHPALRDHRTVTTLRPEVTGRRIGASTSTSDLLSKAQVLEALGVSYGTLFSWMRNGQFPLALELGPPNGRTTKIAWKKSEIDDWLANRPRRALAA